MLFLQLLLRLLLCFYETIMALSFPVVFFIQVHNDFHDLYTFTHFFIEPPVEKKDNRNWAIKGPSLMQYNRRTYIPRSSITPTR